MQEVQSSAVYFNMTKFKGYSALQKKKKEKKKGK